MVKDWHKCGLVVFKSCKYIWNLFAFHPCLCQNNYHFLRYNFWQIIPEQYNLPYYFNLIAHFVFEILWCFSWFWSIILIYLDWFNSGSVLLSVHWSCLSTSTLQPAVRTQVSDLVSSVRSLYNETKLFLSDRASSLVRIMICVCVCVCVCAWNLSYRWGHKTVLFPKSQCQQYHED